MAGHSWTRQEPLRKAVSVLAPSAAAIVLSACSPTPVPFDAAPDPWIKKASASPTASFANGITKDKRAVGAAINEPWSNGQTEGAEAQAGQTADVWMRKLDLLQARLNDAV